MVALILAWWWSTIPYDDVTWHGQYHDTASSLVIFLVLFILENMIWGSRR